MMYPFDILEAGTIHSLNKFESDTIGKILTTDSRQSYFSYKNRPSALLDRFLMNLAYLRLNSV